MQTTKVDANLIDSNADEDQTFDAEALRKLAPFVILDAIQPGDVMLTRGMGKDSKVIASASNLNNALIDATLQLSLTGRHDSLHSYSHAAIWLPMGIPDDDGIYRSQPHKALAESDDLGVGFTHLDLFMLNLGNGRIIAAAKIPTGAVKPVILRHPDLHTKSWQTLMEASTHLINADFFKDYSQFDRLIKPARLPRHLENVARFYMRYQDGKRPELTRGKFCSELVGTFFNLIDMQLFVSGRAPDATTPNDLANRNDCLLRPAEDVPGSVVIDAPHIPNDAHGTYIKRQIKGFDRTDLPVFVKRRSKSDRTIALSEEISSQITQFSDSVADEYIKKCTIRHSILENELQRASERNDQRASRSIIGLIQKSALALELMKECNSFKADRSESIENVERKSCIEWHLFRAAEEFNQEVNRNMIRSTILRNIRALRSAEYNLTKLSKDRRKIHMVRKDLRIIWLKERKSNISQIEFHKEIMDFAKPKTHLDALGIEMLAEAFQRTIVRSKAHDTRK